MKELRADLELERKHQTVHVGVLNAIAHLSGQGLLNASRDLRAALVRRPFRRTEGIWGIYSAVNDEIGFRFWENMHLYDDYGKGRDEVRRP